jgi:hypothetical protein
MLSPCSTALNQDASCNTPCEAEAYGKPEDGDASEWVWTKFSSDGLTVVENPDGGMDGQPNVGCAWRCKQGFRLVEIDLGEVSDSGSSSRLKMCL